ncbi:uncharacterized protein LOC135388258 [Ornithodoros turicata]|uniref:uncharacterized protein LOC135388258 n=1 Tax=Ornithodoros turicata TaxID=34597 RepID=UPI00313A0B6C
MQIALMLLVFAFGIILIIIFSGVLRRHKDEDEETTKGTKGPSNGGRKTAPGSSSDTTTEAPTPPTPEPNFLMCTLGRYQLSGSFFQLPDGLCSIVVLRGYLDTSACGKKFCSNAVVRPYDWLMNLTESGSYSRTRFGLDFYKRGDANDEGVISTSATQLSTPDGRATFTTFFNSGLKDFGILGCVLSRNTTDQYIDDVSNVLTALRAVQIDASSGKEAGYIFLGVAPLYEGDYSNDSVLTSKFHSMIRNVTPDIVLFRTTAYYPSFGFTDCKVTAASLWDKAPLSTQPTFVDSLTFQNKVSLPKTTKRMLSFSISKRINSVISGSSDVGSKCTSAGDIQPYEILCNGSYNSRYEFEAEEMDKERLVAYQRRKDQLKVVYYDSEDTITQKMCKAAVDHGFRGGWVLFDMDCGGAVECTGKEDSDGFALVRAVEANMNKEFDSCPPTNKVP